MTAHGLLSVAVAVVRGHLPSTYIHTYMSIAVVNFYYYQNQLMAVKAVQECGVMLCCGMHSLYGLYVSNDLCYVYAILSCSSALLALLLLLAFV